VQHGKKEGIGAAHHAGYHAAQGEYVMCIDSDLSQSPADLLRMKEVLDSGYDLVVGSRYMKQGKQIGKSVARDWGSKGMNWIARFLLGIPLADCTHTFRAFRISVHESVCPLLDEKGHPSFQIQFCFWAARRGFRITEIPVEFIERASERGKSKISVTHELPRFLALVGRLVFSRLCGTKEGL
jgi:dolichol-phosphate mannosyltransferase